MESEINQTVIKNVESDNDDEQSPHHLRLDSDPVTNDLNETRNNSAAEAREAALNETEMKKTILELQQQEQELKHELKDSREQYDRAAEEFQDAIDHKRLISNTRDHAHQIRTKIEQDLDEIKKNMPTYERSMSILGRQTVQAKEDIKNLERKRSTLLSEERQLASEFRQRGLEHWVESSLKDSVTPFMRDAFVEGTANVVEPMLDGLEKIASVQEDLTKRMSARLHERVRIVEKPFYVGFVTYTVLLTPVVLLMSVVLRLKNRLPRFTVSHFSLLMTGYFGLLSGGCFLAAALWSIDVLLMFRQDSRHVFNFVLLLHGATYMALVAHYFNAFHKVRSRGTLRRAVLLLIVGFHFVIHSYQHAILGKSPHVEMWVYLCYTVILAVVFHERIRGPTFSKSDRKEEPIMRIIKVEKCSPLSEPQVLPKVNKLHNRS